jgi:hypothetical protein
MQHVMRDGAAQGRTLFVPGSRFGEYHIRRLPGQGGMGSVYEAEQALDAGFLTSHERSPTHSADASRESLSRLVPTD